MTLGYRLKLVIAITSLSVVLTATSLLIYYKYTYNIVMDGISKNLLNATSLIRNSLDNDDIERIKRLKSKISPNLEYSKADIETLKNGGIVSGLSENIKADIESDPDFLYLVNKIRKLALLTGNPQTVKDLEYDPEKLHEYVAKGVVVPYITYFDNKYAEYKLNQTIIAPVYQDTGDIKGNSPGTTWPSTIDDNSLKSYQILNYNCRS